MKCVCNSEVCCSCRACEQYCPNKCLGINDTESGFKAIKVEGNDCSACEFKCPQLFPPAKHTLNKLYALQLKDEGELLESTSGGAFSALAQYVFNNKGVVYGAVYDGNMHVKHISAYNLDQIRPMHGSKYIQSEISHCYHEIKEHLENRKMVLFVGLPCQVAGVYAFLGKPYANLLTVDLICSGVPSQYLFDSYIKYIEDKFKIKVLDYKFRDKHKYGLSHTVVITYENRFKKTKCKTIRDRRLVSYYVAFGKENCFMKSCYRCKYNSMERISDFTLGGFWGIQEVETLLNEEKGVSLVLANTSKAQEVIEWCRNIANIEQHDFEIAAISNRALLQSTPEQFYEADLYKSLKTLGYKKTMKKYFKPISKAKSLLTYLKQKVLRCSR